MPRPWEKYAAQPAASPVYVQPNPSRVARESAEEGRAEEAGQRDEVRTGIAARSETRDIGLKLRDDYNASQPIKDYRLALPMFVQGLKTANTPQGSNALIYAYAKIMDPGSVVRETEAEGVANSDTIFGRAYAAAQKQLEGTGTFSPEARAGLIREMRTKMIQMAQAYDAERGRYTADAQAYGIDPERIIGPHAAAPFVGTLQEIDQREGRLTPEQLRSYDEVMAANPNASPAELREKLGAAGLPADRMTNLDEVVEARNKGRGTAPASAATYEQSPVSQTMSGVNTGIANTFGVVRDIPDALQTGTTNAINYLFGSDLKTPGEISEITGQPSLGGGEWWRNKFRDWSLTGAEPTTDVGRFLRRAGESVGAAAVPVGAGAGTMRSLIGGLVAAAGGGAGAATANEVFPNNPAADMTGEFLGSLATGLPLAAAGQAARQRGINAAVPTVDDLKRQASGLYDAAEQRGVVAGPTQTTQLADDFRQTLRNEGQLGPAGRITDAPTSTNKSLNLVEQYEGRQMTPSEMDTVRGVLAEGRGSVEGSDRRLAGLLTDQFDDWVRPMAPEFDQARDVASRYLQAEDLGKARELADVEASKFTGSGLENALRTQFRGLDRNVVNERNWFTPEVQDAIRKVSRGTWGSNLARGLGRMAPTGPVSGALGIGAPTALGAYLGGPVGAMVAGTGAAGLGIGGRMAATRMGVNAANMAELTARNGGAVARAPFLDPEAERLALALLASQGATGQVNPTPPRQRGMFGAR